MQPTRPEDALLTDAFADFLEKCRAKNLSEKTLNIYPFGNDSAVSNFPYEKRNLYPYPQNEWKTGSLQFERQSAENQAQKYVQG